MSASRSVPWLASRRRPLRQQAVGRRVRGSQPKQNRERGEVVQIDQSTVVVDVPAHALTFTPPGIDGPVAVGIFFGPLADLARRTISTTGWRKAAGTIPAALLENSTITFHNFDKFCVRVVPVFGGGTGRTRRAGFLADERWGSAGVAPLCRRGVRQSWKVKMMKQQADGPESRMRSRSRRRPDKGGELP